MSKQKRWGQNARRGGGGHTCASESSLLMDCARTRVWATRRSASSSCVSKLRDKGGAGVG